MSYLPPKTMVGPLINEARVLNRPRLSEQRSREAQMVVGTILGQLKNVTPTDDAEREEFRVALLHAAELLAKRDEVHSQQARELATRFNPETSDDQEAALRRPRTQQVKQ